MSILNLFKKKSDPDCGGTTMEIPDYLDINIGMDDDGEVYLNFYKRGEKTLYEKFTPQDHEYISQLITVSSSIIARLREIQYNTTDSKKNPS